MLRPLEERFPTLYHDIVHESPASGAQGLAGPAKEKRTPKKDPPTLHQVIEAVCSTHRVTDIGLMKDLAATISEFLAPAKETKEEKSKGKKAKDDDE